ncbi:hypothetical protein AAFF_G00427200 [Aldrovandia affinis]|uniref:CREB regulated transcription coactivator 2 n=1 Tax=Aldrovandia affinis TaxID=143900 RepID=A0AAD7S9J6_9TELE|nr:hypothetical protein AAFF_G00427200 [Aldrovandia affinis]
MSAAGTGGCGPGPGAVSGASNPRKFSEKIALHTQRQAEETAAFREVMMDITSTRIQAQKVRLARNQVPCYGGSLPNVNQIGRNTPDLQGTFHSNLDSSRSTRHHGLVERVQRDRRFISPVRPYRRQIDSSPYNAAYLSPPPDPSWRRNWSDNFPMDKNQLFRLPTTALNRTNSDSALHTSVMNPNTTERFSSSHTPTPQSRLSGVVDGDSRKMFPYPVPPIEENILDEGKLLKPWDSKKLPNLSSRPKSCEVPGINVFPSPDQQSSAPHIPLAMNTGGSLPDLSSLHFPSPLPTPLDPEEPGYPSISGGCSTGNLTNTLTQLGITPGNTFHSAGLSVSLQGAACNSFLQSSLSNPNIKSSLSSHSFPTSLSSTSLHSSLSNPSLQSSLSSSPSLQSSLSNQSLHSSLSNSSLQSAASNPSYSSGVGGSGSCSSSYSPLLAGQAQPQLSTSPRRRAQLSPLILPVGGESRRHHPKQFSPTISPTLSSITQGVPLDTSKLPMDQRLPPYPYSQPQQPQTGPPVSHQPLQKGVMSSPAGQTMQQPQASQQAILHQPNQQQQLLHHHQQQQQHQCTHMQPQDLLLQLQNMQNLHTVPMQHVQRPAAQTQTKTQVSMDTRDQNSQCMQPHLREQNMQNMQNLGAPEPQHSLPHLQHISHSLATDLGLYNDSSLLNSLLDDPYLDLQLTARQSQALSQQFNMENQVEGLSFNHSSGSRPIPSKWQEATLDFQNSGDQQLLNNPNQNYRGGGHHNVPNIVLTGDSPPGLSKEITSALSGVPGFEVDPFSLDETLRMDPLALEGLGMLADGDLMLADPDVEDSFRSDRLK